MAYARMGPDSDVYVYRSVLGGYDCCGCRLATTTGWHHTDTPHPMIAHLHLHEAAGHQVPQRALDRLTADTAR